MINLNKVVGVRLSSELYQLLQEVCKSRGEDVSGFVRRAVLKELATLSFLPETQKKALGIELTPKG